MTTKGSMFIEAELRYSHVASRSGDRPRYSTIHPGSGSGPGPGGSCPVGLEDDDFFRRHARTVG